MIPSIQNITNKRKSRSIASFLKKTFQLLNDQENHKVARWAPNGIGFVVLNEQDFAKIVLPKYFKHSNYSSFVRQLNMYNFHKIRENNSESYFHHEHFDRDNKNSLAEIKRKPQKKKRKMIDEQDSENFQKDDVQIVEIQNKENSIFKSDKSVEAIMSYSSKMVSEEDYSQKILDKNKLIENNSISTTKQLFSSQFTLKFQNPISENNSDKKIEQNIWQGQDDDDKISINNDIESKIVPFPTKELMYPSKNNIFPFTNKETFNFNIFF